MAGAANTPNYSRYTGEHKPAGAYVLHGELGKIKPHPVGGGAWRLGMFVFCMVIAIVCAMVYAWASVAEALDR